MKIYQTIIVGGGPSGISCSYHLQTHNIEHLIIEKNEMLHTWKKERWDSFYLVTPNWMTNLPGMEHLIPYNNEFMSKIEIENLLVQYMQYVSPNYVEKTTIKRINKEKGYYELVTDKGSYYAESIIIAVGMFNQPFIPDLSKKIPESVHQLHSKDYLNPKQLKDGATLVVGSGRSGIQIALEVKEETRKPTFLSVGSLTPLPVIYKNINGVFWLNRLSGYSEDLNFLQYHHDDLDNQNIVNKINQNLYHCQIAGVEILGRFINVIDQKLEFSNDLKKVLDDGEVYLDFIRKKINDYIDESQLQVSGHEVDFNLEVVDHSILAPLEVIDINLDHIKNVIWCTGFKPNYDWLTLDIFDEDGQLNLINNVETKENVYFCGMGLEPDPDTKSSFGVGLYALSESAKRAVEALIKRS
jgi:putative flavoprotein involved in K+ transport